MMILRIHRKQQTVLLLQFMKKYLKGEISWVASNPLLGLSSGSLAWF